MFCRKFWYNWHEGTNSERRECGDNYKVYSKVLSKRKGTIFWMEINKCNLLDGPGGKYFHHYALLIFHTILKAKCNWTWPIFPFIFFLVHQKIYINRNFNFLCSCWSESSYIMETMRLRVSLDNALLCLCLSIFTVSRSFLVSINPIFYASFLSICICRLNFKVIPIIIMRITWNKSIFRID